MSEQKPFLSFLALLCLSIFIGRTMLFMLLQNMQNYELHFTIYVTTACHFEVVLEFQQLVLFLWRELERQGPATLPNTTYLWPLSWALHRLVCIRFSTPAFPNTWLRAFPCSSLVSLGTHRSFPSWDLPSALFAPALQRMTSPGNHSACGHCLMPQLYGH